MKNFNIEQLFKTSDGRSHHFKNPIDGQIKTVSTGSCAGVLCFGAAYLLIKRLWGHAAIYILFVCLIHKFVSPPMVTVSTLALNVIYAILIRNILSLHYVRKGWIEVGLTETTKTENQTSIGSDASKEGIVE